MKNIYKQIRTNPDFLELIKLRKKISWSLTAIVIFCYFTFIIIIAFAPDIFSIKIFDDSVITLGIVIGLLVILLSIFLTGIYVYIANKKLEEKNLKILKKITANQDAMIVPSFLSLLFIFFSLNVYANSDLSANSDSVNIIAIFLFFIFI